MSIPTHYPQPYKYWKEEVFKFEENIVQNLLGPFEKYHKLATKKPNGTVMGKFSFPFGQVQNKIQCDLFHLGSGIK